MTKPGRAARSVHAFSIPVVARFLALWAPLCLLLGAGVWLLDHQNRTREKLVRRYEGTHIVNLQAELMLSELGCCKSDLLYLSEAASLQRFLSGTPSGKRELGEEYRLFSAKKMVYDQIRYLNTNGWETVRVNYNRGKPTIVPREELQSKSGRYYLGETLALNKGEIYMSPLDLNVEHGKVEEPWRPMIRLSTPVFDAAGRKSGILVLNYLGARIIGEARAISASLPGTAMLLNQDGYWFAGLGPEGGAVGGRGREFAPDTSVAWAEIARSREGQFETSRGLFTYKTLGRPVSRPANGTDAPSSGSATAGGQAEENLVTVVFHVPSAALYPRSDQLLGKFMVIYALVIAILMILAWRAAYIATLRKWGQEKLRKSEARLRSLSTQLITAQEEERRSISRDLHDDLGQLVTSISLDLQRVGQEVRGRNQHLINRALNATRCLLGKVQDISSRLRPPILDDLGLKDAAQSYLARFELETGIETHAELRFECLDVPPDVGESIYRILQEALTNVVKHSRADSVRVRLDASDAGIDLDIRDAGIGFGLDLSNDSALGILGMRERAELLDGTFSLRTAPGTGTEIHVHIPISDLRATSAAGE